MIFRFVGNCGYCARAHRFPNCPSGQRPARSKLVGCLSGPEGGKEVSPHGYSANRRYDDRHRIRKRSERLAERVGFEPTSRFLGNTLSKRAPSATRTPLHSLCYRLLALTNPIRIAIYEMFGCMTIPGTTGFLSRN